MHMKLHDNQITLLKYLKKIPSLEGLSLWQISRDTGLNNAQTVSHHLKQLEKYGYLRRSACDPNNFEVLKDPIEDLVYINQYGFAQCGHWSEFLSEGNLDDKIAISTKLFGVSNPKNLFAARAKGDSMAPYILENDLVLFNKQDDTNNAGEISLVIEAGKPKIKKVYKEKGSIILESINPTFKPEKIKSSHIRILGVAKGVIHQF